jgi:hypothetical protein
MRLLANLDPEVVLGGAMIPSSQHASSQSEWDLQSRCCSVEESVKAETGAGRGLSLHAHRMARGLNPGSQHESNITAKDRNARLEQ